MKSFRFINLWLLSELDQKARVIEFRENVNALIGTNHTGKSTIVRNLFTAFGCKTRPYGKEWRQDTISAVEFSVEEKYYLILHREGIHTLFDASLQVLWSTSDGGELRDHFSSLVGFTLPLMAQDGEIRTARPSFFFVPFFVDQDGSWDAPWRTFQSLGEFKQWERATLDIALGARAPVYWETWGEVASTKKIIEDLSHELRLLSNTRARLAEQFPKAPWFRDALAFRKDLKELEERADKLSKDQSDLRRQATDTTTSINVMSAQVRLIEGALIAHSEDMSFLDGLPSNQDITCPTCGTAHEHSFHERMKLEAEADELRELKSSFKARMVSYESSQALTQDKLLLVDKQANEIDELLDRTRGDLRLREVIDRAGLDKAFSAFEMQLEKISKSKARQEEALSDLENLLRSLDDKKHTKKVRDTFNSLYAKFAGELGVPPSLLNRKGEIKVKPQQGGSGGPRAILAYYFAMAHTANMYSSQIIPPLVIDSPHQKAQDDINRPIVTEFIVRNRVPGQQLIVGLEEDVPVSVVLDENDMKLMLADKFSVLIKSDYKKSYDFFASLISREIEFVSKVLN